METISIMQAGDADFSYLNQLFNTCAEKELPYKKLTSSDWVGTFARSTEQCEKHIFEARCQNQPVGFSAGCFDKSSAKCYITFVLVQKEYRHLGIATSLLNALEQQLITCVQGTDTPSGILQISFFNPCALTWLIPGTAKHDHPNAPGVDISSDAYKFFIKTGYKPFVFQNSFYLPLAHYEEPDSVLSKKEQLANRGITFEFYDSSKHHGLEALCKDLGNPVWEKELIANDNLGKDGYPLMAAILEHQIVGFTGPLRVQESGRGYFSGIGVHSNYRGLGLGSLLFHLLCSTLKSMGADFMTLFTGTTNPAANIYQTAGFQIVKTWADMEKSF